MTRHPGRIGLIALTAATVCAGAVLTGQEASRAPLALDSVRITLSGTSNIHDYTASTTTARLLSAELGGFAAGPALLEHALKPGAVQAFAIAIPAETLTSDKSGLDKNMHKALKTKQHPDIVFRLANLEPVAGAPDVYRATGALTIAGVEREVAFDVTITRRNGMLAVSGAVDLLMTDFGIAPPRAMMGMLRTSPKVTVQIQTVVAISQT